MENILQLAQQVERQRKLQMMENSLKQQVRDLEKKSWNLKYDWSKEQQDVEKLKQFSLTGLFYDLMGKKAEKMEQEQREALAAAAKYQAAQAELEGVKRELEQIADELRQLLGCEVRYTQAKELRAGQLKAEDPVLGPQIAEAEAKLAEIAGQKQELKEAITAGQRALSTARSVQKELDSAEDWGTWDMLGGGGLITQMAKHDHLDSAQNLVNHLQSQLRAFRTELADVEIQVQFQVQIDEFLRFADWFFDGLIVDWTVQDKIHEAQNSMYGVVCQIQRLLDRLENLDSDLQRREDQTKGELEKLLLPGII